MAKKVMA
jgi:hypothetical protein